MRPSKFFESWSARDQVLAIGLSEYEAAYYMGIPQDVVWDDDSDGYLVAVPKVNQVDAAIERAQAKSKEPEPGTRYRVYDLRVHPEYEKYAD